MKNMIPMHFTKNCTLLGISAVLTPTFFLSCSQTKQNDSNTFVRPNFIIIIADDLGWADVGYHGSEIKTPTLDKMTKEGVEFDQFYVCSVSSPTRASLLTGRYPSRYGILSPLGDEPGLPANTVTLAELLRNEGYDTKISGKWHLGATPEGRPMKYGFNESYGSLRGQIDPYTHLYKNGDQTWHRNDILISEDGHATDLITNDAIDFIQNKRNTDRPFFLYISYTVPHSPLDEPKEWIDLYSDIENESRRKFAASVSHMDNSIEKILNNIEKAGIQENTIVMFLSDNGGQENWSSDDEYGGKFKNHDVLGNNKPLRDWKGSLYDGALRVPAILIWPGKLNHMKIDYPVGVVDIYPTLAFLGGIEITNDLNIEGINFWPLIKDESIEEDRTLYWRSNNAFALRKGDWKLIHKNSNFSEGIDELYNISKDPYETNDLSRDNTEKLMELKLELESHIKSDIDKNFQSTEITQ